MPTSQKTYLITGGAGFLGYHLAPAIARRGGRVVIFDIVEIDPKEYPADTVYIKDDVRDAAALRRASQGVAVIIHAAAALPLCSAEEIRSVSIEGTRNILTAAKEQHIPRVVYVSSTAVYGIPKKHPIEETDPSVGVGPYGESKIEAEKLCEAARREGLCVPIIRPKTFIGTGRLGVFQILFDWVREGRRIPIIGRGDNRYQLLEVTDLVEAIMLAAEAPAERANHTFNVGAKEFGRVRDDVGALCNYARQNFALRLAQGINLSGQAGAGSHILPTPAWLAKPVLGVLHALKLSPLYKWVYATADKDSFVSTEKIERALLWQPRFSNAAALINAYQWYLDHWQELQGQSGVTHRVAWKQGALGLIRRFL